MAVIYMFCKGDLCIVSACRAKTTCGALAMVVLRYDVHKYLVANILASISTVTS